MVAETDWRTRAACRPLPPEWWETGDGGNRLALAFCRLRCTVKAECDQLDPTEIEARQRTSVIRAAVPYGAEANELRVCACGYPVVRGGATDSCVRCSPPAQPWLDELHRKLRRLHGHGRRGPIRRRAAA